MSTRQRVDAYKRRLDAKAFCGRYGRDTVAKALAWLDKHYTGNSKGAMAWAAFVASPIEQVAAVELRHFYAAILAAK